MAKPNLLVFKTRKRNSDEKTFPRKWEFVCHYSNDSPTLHTRHSSTIRGLAKEVIDIEVVKQNFNYGLFAGGVSTDNGPEHNRIYTNGSFYCQEAGVDAKQLFEFHTSLINSLRNQS